MRALSSPCAQQLNWIYRLPQNLSKVTKGQKKSTSFFCGFRFNSAVHKAVSKCLRNMLMIELRMVPAYLENALERKMFLVCLGLIPGRKDLKLREILGSNYRTVKVAGDWRHFLLRSHSLPLCGQNRLFSTPQKIWLLLNSASNVGLGLHLGRQQAPATWVPLCLLLCCIVIFFFLWIPNSLIMEARNMVPIPSLIGY